MTKSAYCSKELCKMLDKAGIEAKHIMAFEKGGSWYKKYTLDIAQRWLREEKYILIFIVPGHDDSGNLTYVADVWIWNEDKVLYESHWATADHTYEEALEAAIKYCLENLINN